MSKVLPAAALAAPAPHAVAASVAAARAAAALTTQDPLAVEVLAFFELAVLALDLVMKASGNVFNVFILGNLSGSFDACPRASKCC